MLVYLYDEETKEFLREEEAFIDPLETQLKGEDVFLLPSNGTFEKPLDKEEGKAVIFKDNKWELVEDYRERYCLRNGRMQLVKKLGHVDNVLSEEEAEGVYRGDLIIDKDKVIPRPAPTKEEISALREKAYIREVDKITCHINRLKDEEQTEEVVAKIEALKQERATAIDSIKQKYPYHVEE